MAFPKSSKRDADSTQSEEPAGTKEDTSESSGEYMEVGLAAFEAVKAADEKESAAAEAEKPERKNRKKWALLILLLLAIAAIAIALAVTLTGKDDKGDEAPPTAKGVPEEDDALLELLKPHTPEETLLDDTTPQGQAYRQLTREFSEPLDEFRVLQRYALMTLYFSTTPDGWIENVGWDGFSSDECSWYGVEECRASGQGNAVRKIQLALNNLAGTIPSELCLLGDNLEHLDMGNGFLVGSIPQCFAEFKSLVHLEIHDNDLTGPLPRGLLTIPSLEVVELHGNELDGSLGVLLESDNSSAALASGLRVLTLNQNNFSGGIPIELFSLGSLSILRLSENNLEGELDSVCVQGGVPAVFTYDCGKVTCSCCGACT